MEAPHIIAAIKLPSLQAIHAYLYTMGLLATLMLLLAFLWLVGYLIEQVFLMVTQIVHLFGACPPVVQVVFLALLIVPCIWFLLTRAVFVSLKLAR